MSRLSIEEGIEKDKAEEHKQAWIEAEYQVMGWYIEDE